MSRFVSDVLKNEEDLYKARLVYCLVGYFQYGWRWQPEIIPAEHIASLVPRFQQVLIEDEASQARRQSYEQLRADLLGIKPDVLEPVVYATHKAPERSRRPAPAYQAPKPAPKREPAAPSDGSIDYAAVINSMTEEAA